jgi:glutaredoxin
MLIVIIISSLIVTFIVLYLIKSKFDNFKIKSIPVPFKLNIKSDKVIVLSKIGCPWCDKLGPYLDTAKNEYTKIIVNDDNTFKFDEKFSELKEDERESIIKGSRELMDNVGYYFPTIVRNNEYFIGFPEEEILNKILNE